MIIIHKNFSLKSLNTFGLSSKAAFYSAINDKEQLKGISGCSEYKNGLFILGGGSNLLLTKDIDEWVLHNQIKGISLIHEDDHHAWLEVGGGEIWHHFVLKSIELGYSGIENLSLIPGSVGAAPVQNIGAYGVEAKEVIETVNAWHLTEEKPCQFNNKECAFGYRDSIFKRQYKGSVFITSVIFKLNKKPNFNIEYGDIKKELEIMGVKELSTRTVSDAVIRIRQSKLPDPAEIGNSGSFFKNPIIEKSLYDKLKIKHPEIPGYALDDNKVKVPAAWMIQQCGWKGYREGDIGVHPRQALVLVNYGNGIGSDIYQLSEKIIQSVFERFSIRLEREVNIY